MRSAPLMHRGAGCNECGAAAKTSPPKIKRAGPALRQMTRPEPTVARKPIALAANPFPSPWVCLVVSAALAAVGVEAVADAPPEAGAAVVVAAPAAVGAAAAAVADAPVADAVEPAADPDRVSSLGPAAVADVPVPSAAFSGRQLVAVPLVDDPAAAASRPADVPDPAAGAGFPSLAAACGPPAAGSRWAAPAARTAVDRCVCSLDACWSPRDSAARFAEGDWVDYSLVAG